MKKCFFQKHDFLQIGKVFVCDDGKSYRIEIGPPEIVGLPPFPAAKNEFSGYILRILRFGSYRPKTCNAGKEGKCFGQCPLPQNHKYLRKITAAD